MYLYTLKDGWSEIDDFFDDPNESDVSKQLVNVGYTHNPGIQVGDLAGSSFAVEVYMENQDDDKEAAPYKYLVCIDVCAEWNLIAVPALPDLLNLLSQVVPTAKNIDDWIRRAVDEQINREKNNKYSKAI